MRVELIREIFDEIAEDQFQANLDYSLTLKGMVNGDCSRDQLMVTAFKAGAIAILTVVAELKGPHILAELEDFLEFIVNEEV
jgi:hypothetical protein